MAGRGRGGRGRGRGMSFDVSAMGIGPGEPLPAPILQPPPTYPPLEHQPAPMQSTLEMEYMVALKKDFVVFFNNYLCIPDRGGSIKDSAGTFDWRFLPAELMPKATKVIRKRSATPVASVQKKTNVDLSLLDELAKMEENVDEPEAEQETETDNAEKQEAEEEQNEEEEDLDEEMDDGTDYVNNYFDNGEGFDDDDDNGNDGPVY